MEKKLIKYFSTEEVENTIKNLEIDASLCRAAGYKKGGGYQELADMLRSLLTERDDKTESLEEVEERGQLMERASQNLRRIDENIKAIREGNNLLEKQLEKIREILGEDNE